MQKEYKGILSIRKAQGTEELVWIVQTSEHPDGYLIIEDGDILQIHYLRPPTFNPEILFNGQVDGIDTKACFRTPLNEGCAEVPLIDLILSRVVQFHVRIKKDSESFGSSIFSTLFPGG